MADYERMYLRCFRAMTAAHGALRQAMEILEYTQKECEDFYVATTGVSREMQLMDEEFMERADGDGV